jgi:L-rhamnose-H+ transport protein
MIPITPNPLLGIGFHSVGAFFAANCYAPQQYIRRWSWEVYWIAQASWCWLLWPIIGALLTIPHIGAVLAAAPKELLLYTFLLGVAYGVGGTAFNISIRYIGYGLTYAIAVGLSSVLGTLIPPLVHGRFGEILSAPGSGWILAGVAGGTIGIGLCGVAGRLKEGDLAASIAGTGNFSMVKGLLLSLLAGVLSAVYGFALDCMGPVADIAEQYGAGVWKGNIAYLFANTGAFVSAVLYAGYLVRKNGTYREFVSAPEGRGRLGWNYFYALLTGTLWYGQFFFYNLGHVHLGKQYAFSSWAIHMIMLVLFSNIVAIFFKEWKGCHGRTKTVVGFGLAVLCAAVLFLAYGNYIGEHSP